MTFRHRTPPRRAAWTGLLLGLAAASPSAAGTPPAGGLTPIAAYHMALAQTPSMIEARAGVAEAHGALRQARGGLLPRLGLSFTASGSNNPLDVLGMKLQQQHATFNDFGAGSFLQGIQNNSSTIVLSAPAELNQPGFYTNYQTRLQLSVPIYNGGRIWGGLHRAEALVDAARRGERRARQQLLFEVIRRYEKVRTAQAFIGVAAQALQAARANTALTEKLYRRGTVAKTDVLRADVQLHSARFGLMQARQHSRLAREGLRILIGLPARRALHLARGSLTITVPHDGIAGLKHDAEHANPGLEALDARVRAARAGVRQARAAYLPHVNLTLAREWNDRTVSLSHPSYTVTGELRWDLFDLGTRRGALDQAQARVLRRRATLRQARERLRLQVERAWQQTHLAAARIRMQQATVAAAAETARLETLRYRQGVSIFTQLLSAQTELDRARADLVAARYQEVMARAALLLALGRLTPDTVAIAAARTGP